MVNKSELRARLIAEQKNLKDTYVLQSDADISNWLVALPEYISAKTVFVFCSVGNEVDTRSLIDKSLKDGKHVALPVTLGAGIMEFALVTSLPDLCLGRLDIPEPEREAERIVPREEDIMIIPGLAFDVGGNRLGRGAGYYDRYLANCVCPKVGLCREAFFLERIPCEEHDVRVDCVITEKGITRPPKESRL